MEQHEIYHAWVQDGDAVVIFNFRADRVVELSKALEYTDFDKFDRKRWPAVSISITPHAAHNLKLARIRVGEQSRPPRTPSCLCSQQGMRVHTMEASQLACYC